MAPAGSLDSIDQMRTELSGLVSLKLVRSDAPLDRRGVEIDHNLYEPREGQTMTPRTTHDDVASAPAPLPSAAPAAARPVGAAPVPSADLANRVAALEAACADLRSENRELREQLDQLRQSLEDLRRALGA
jgi:hypothetical protein